MGPEAQQIAIAQACGWKKMNWNGVAVYGSPTHGFRVWKSKQQDSIMSYKGRVGERIPDYLNDLNACHEFEKILIVLGPPALDTYEIFLLAICTRASNRIFRATAAQRCEAF